MDASDIQLEYSRSVQRLAELEERYRSLIDKEKNLQSRLAEQLEEARENEFQRKYGQPSSTVRDGYINRLKSLCGPCNRGHYVQYIDINSVTLPKWFLNIDVVAPNACHTYLLPENLDQATLTEMEEKAFEMVGKRIWIDPEPHEERWGN